MNTQFCRIIVRSVLSAAILLLTVSWCDTPARGEEGASPRPRHRGRARHRGIDKPALMRSEQVQKELGVSVQQKETVDEWVAAYREQSRALRGARRGLRDLSSDEREKKSAEFRAKRKALVEEAERKLASLLTPAQMNRLDEIALQQRGAEALVDPEVSRAVKLTEEQSASIKMILEMRGKEQRKLWEKGRGGAREGIREKMRQLRRDAEAQALAVLTDVQKNELKVLRGAPFELDRKSLRSGDRSGPGADGRKGDGGKRRGSPADDSEA